MAGNGVANAAVEVASETALSRALTRRPGASAGELYGGAWTPRAPPLAVDFWDLADLGLLSSMVPAVRVQSVSIITHMNTQMFIREGFTILIYAYAP